MYIIIKFKYTHLFVNMPNIYIYICKSIYERYLLDF